MTEIERPDSAGTAEDPPSLVLRPLGFGDPLRWLALGWQDFRRAPGLGLFLIEEGLDENLANPEFTVELIDVQVIPEPMSLSLLAVGLSGLAWIRRRAQ